MDSGKEQKLEIHKMGLDWTICTKHLIVGKLKKVTIDSHSFETFMKTLISTQSPVKNKTCLQSRDKVHRFCAKREIDTQFGMSQK